MAAGTSASIGRSASPLLGGLGFSDFEMLMLEVNGNWFTLLYRFWDRIKKGDREVDRRISKTYRALASGIIMQDEVDFSKEFLIVD